MKKPATVIQSGIHPVLHTMRQTPQLVLEVWLADSRKMNTDIETVISLAKEYGLHVQQVHSKKLDALTDGQNHQGVAIRRRTQLKRDENDLGVLLQQQNEQPSLFLILDGVQDPHNLGACLRTADATGVNAVIIPKDKSVQVNETVSKVACGAAETVPVIAVTNLARSMRTMQQANVWLIGTDDEAESEIYSIDFNRHVAIVMGAEGKGLRQNTRKHCDELVRLPMFGSVQSLNVSVAAGVCLYEVIRQRR